MNTENQICANCGKKKETHLKMARIGVGILKKNGKPCKKFKPQTPQKHINDVKEPVETII
mgnify:CR=1 FL=1